MQTNNKGFVEKLAWVAVFSVSMAFVESAVVVYLRAIYYPEGFAFPLKPLTDTMIGVELLREVATIFMLLSVAVLSGRKLWERFAYFMLCFGIWDIFYYVWLKVLLGWPSSLFEWDILFLIPLPWIGPVIAPVSISFLMIAFSIAISYSFHRGHDFRPLPVSKILVLAGTFFILFSFMRDIDATLYQQEPRPYLYVLLIFGEVLYVTAFTLSYARTVHGTIPSPRRE